MASYLSLTKHAIHSRILATADTRRGQPCLRTIAIAIFDPQPGTCLLTSVAVPRNAKIVSAI
jgi:hypothetical protein